MSAVDVTARRVAAMHAVYHERDRLNAQRAARPLTDVEQAGVVAGCLAAVLRRVAAGERVQHDDVLALSAASLGWLEQIATRDAA